MNNPAIKVENISRWFGDITAVDEVSFSVTPGELFGLVGPDGAGKTTLLRMLSGVLSPNAGDAELLGVSVSVDPETVKQEIAYMPQRFGLYTDLTVMENLDFYADLYDVGKKERKERLQRLFHFSNLSPFKQRLAGALSGGMKQKLALSCALIHMPKILLLDEPTFGVDPISRRDLWLIVHEMVEEGVTAIVSTAYMDEAERFDRVALLNKGQILAMDSPDQLQNNLEGDILTVMSSNPRQARDALRSESFVKQASLFGDKLHVNVRSASEGISRIEQLLTQNGLSDIVINKSTASLEDVFIQYMNNSVAEQT